LWPSITHQRAELVDHTVIDEGMIEPLASEGTNGFVPLCVALHWIMTKGGALRLTVDDQEAWDTACEKLFPLIHEGTIGLLGRRSGRPPVEKIAGYSLALVKIVRPLNVSIDAILSNDAYIWCTVFGGTEHWRSDYNDELHLDGRTA